MMTDSVSVSKCNVVPGSATRLCVLLFNELQYVSLHTPANKGYETKKKYECPLCSMWDFYGSTLQQEVVVLQLPRLVS